MSVVSPTNYKSQKPRLSFGLHDDVGCDAIKVARLRLTHSPKCDLSVTGRHRLREASSGGLPLSFLWRLPLPGRPSLLMILLRYCSSMSLASLRATAQNCGKIVIFVCRGLPRTFCAGFIHFYARRCSKTYILEFWMARCCSETHILLLLDEPSRRIRRVDCTKLWRNANFLEIVGSLAQNVRFRSLVL